MAVKIRAFAKINLGLRVLGARPDGYHELQTVFQAVKLHDTLTLSAGRGAFRIDCDDPDCPTDRRNLLWRAAERLWRAAGRKGRLRGVVVRLEKRIPQQAGLGGGSSDAAAALRGLARLWRARLSDEELRSIASTVGADVPYFLVGGTVLGLERGDLLVPLPDRPRAWVVLVVPAFGVSTKDAFGWWDEATVRRKAKGATVRLKADTTTDLADVASGFSRAGTRLTNDLEGPVIARYPVIGRLIRALRRHGASHAGMSGSGSAVFGLFAQRADAARAARGMTGSASRALLTQTLSRKECRRGWPLAAK
jgi:4-diphosphocytidyl-2-C-methyl-D-erythritol kinase